MNYGYNNPRLMAALASNPMYAMNMGAVQRGSSTAPVQSWVEGLARALQAPVGAIGGQMAKQQMQEEMQAKDDALITALMGEPTPGGQPDPARERIKQGLASGMITPEMFGPAMLEQAGYGGKQKKPSSIAEYEFAKGQGFTGSLADWKRLGRPAGTNVTVSPTINPGVPNDPLLETLGEKEAEAWSGYIDAGNSAASKMQDFEALEVLAGTVDTGPLVGRFAEMFPGFDSGTAAFQSVVSRVAPQMRVPGSGATSDKEVNMFLEALPRLRYDREANMAIVGMLKNKAQLDIRRSEIVTAAANGEISPQEARRGMLKLNRQSVMPDALRQRLRGLGSGRGEGGGDIGNGITAVPPDGGLPDVRKMSDEELRRLANGG